MSSVARLACAIGVGAFLICASFPGRGQSTAEIKVASGTGMKTVLEVLLPQFERATGHKVAADYGTGGEVKKWVESGDRDVVIGARAAFDDLLRDGRVLPDSVVDVGRSFVGIAVRAGAPKPDIASSDELIRTLRAAKGIVYADPASGSASANHFVRVLARLGLTDEMKAKTHFGRRAAIAQMLVQGDADIAVSQISELLPLSGIEIVGPLPVELQDLKAFTVAAGIVTGARQPDAGRALIRFITGPAAAPVMKAKGLQPG